MSFISDDLLKKTKKKLENVIVLKGFLEAVDGPIINFAISYLDSNYADKIPVKYQDEVILLLEAFVNSDYDKLAEATASAIDEIVDLPFASEDVTAKFIAMNIKMLKDFIFWLAKK
jgi:predicted unusual protein kinase regulating ubiquinone biosynthesis (AarF/ABC1/UbiB family)